MPEPKPDQSVRISSSRNQTLVFSNVTPPLYLSINPSFWGSSWKQIADMSKLTPQWCIFKSSPGNSNAARVETLETRSSRIPHYGAALQLWICVGHSQAGIVSHPPTLPGGFWTFLLQFCNIHANVSGVRWKKYLPAPQPRRSAGQRHDVIAVLYHPIVLCSRLVDTKKKRIISLRQQDRLKFY